MTLLIPRKGSIFQEEIFCLLSFVDEKSHVTAIVYDNVHTLTLAIIIGPRKHLGCIPSTLQVILLSMRKQQQNRHEQSRKLLPGPGACSRAPSARSPGPAHDPPSIPKRKWRKRPPR